jgi:hypothetical protein
MLENVGSNGKLAHHPGPVPSECSTTDQKPIRACDRAPQQNTGPATNASISPMSVVL